MQNAPKVFCNLGTGDGSAELGFSRTGGDWGLESGSPFLAEPDDLGVARLIGEHDHPGGLIEALPAVDVGSDRDEVEVGELHGHHGGGHRGTVGDEFDRGVVEGVGTLDSFTPEGEAIVARFITPPELLRHMVVKGPVCIDGISLTIVAKDETSFSVSLVQYTQEHTNLVRRRPGDRINLETDILARYVEQILAASPASGRGTQ